MVSCARCLIADCSVYEFSDGWENRWVKSDWKRDENVAGEWNYTSGKWSGDPNDKGMQLVLIVCFSTSLFYYVTHVLLQVLDVCK